MAKFDLNKLNAEKIKLEEQPLKLKKVTYKKPKIKNGMLVDNEGNPIGTKGDMYTKYIMDKILREGCLDHNPRPHYEEKYENAKYNKSNHTIITKDNKKIKVTPTDQVIEKENCIEVWVPAHTISVNKGIECTYDLSKGESPMITLRPIAVKASIAEILWIKFLEKLVLIIILDHTMKINMNTQNITTQLIL